MNIVGNHLMMVFVNTTTIQVIVNRTTRKMMIMATSLPGSPEMLSKLEKLRTPSAPVQDAVPSDTSKLKFVDILSFLRSSSS